MGVPIIHRSTDFYIVTKIYGWGAYYIRSFTVNIKQQAHKAVPKYRK